MHSWLEEIDHSIVLAVNAWHTPFLDEFMWLLSSKVAWIPFYVFLIFLASRKINGKQTILFIVTVIVAVGASDLIATYGFKHVFLRYRPSHNLLLKGQLHFYESSPGQYYQGGVYGFISSHAANFFAWATFAGVVLNRFYPKLFVTLLWIAASVSFSRLYLGVHYLSDLLVGALLGSAVAFLLYRFVYLRLELKFKK
jgi:undecaprenyl-diphosphatase